MGKASTKQPGKRKTDKRLEELAEVFCDPIVVMPGGWGDTLPEWLRKSIALERLEAITKPDQEGQITGTDAEVCAYLYTASLVAPLDSDWTEIFLYLATKTVSRWRKTEIPEDISTKKISDYHQHLLDQFKRRIYERRIKARVERRRAERRSP